MARKRAFRQITKDNDTKYDGGKGRAEAYFNDVHSGKNIDSVKLNELLQQYIPKSSDNSIFRDPFTNKEITTRLNKMSNTSPGPDKIEYKHLKSIDNTGRVLTFIFNKCREAQRIPNLWKTAHTVLIYKKGDNMDPSNFRPIALQSCLYKLFVAIVSDRLSKWANNNNLLSNCQKGFRQGEGCYEHTFMLQSVVKDARNNGKKLSIAWLDLQNAFGSVPHEAITLTLTHMGLPVELVNLISDLYTNASSTFQTNEGDTNAIPILAGVKQGCPLSPILFNLTLEVLMRAVVEKAKENIQSRLNEIPATIYGVPISILAYADDLVLVSRSVKGLQMLLDKAGLAATILGLIFKPTKCATLTLNCKGGTKVINEDYFVQGKKLPSLNREEPYRYLGVPVGIEVEQHEANEICENLVTDLDKIENSLLAPWQKLDAIRTFLQPKLSYILRAGDVKIKTLQNYRRKLISTLKRICHLPVRATNNYFFARQSAGGLGFQDPNAEVHIQKIVQAVRMLNCKDSNVKQVARESLRYSFHRCLPGEPTNIDFEAFLSGSTEGPFKNYSKLGNVRFLWSGVRAACRFLDIKISNFEGNVSIQYDKSRIRGKPSTLTGTLRELIKDYHSAKLVAKPDQGKVTRSLVQDKYSNGSSWLFTGYGIRFCDWRFIHRARLNLLPTNQSRGKWYNTSKQCRRCQTGIETLPHAICHCLPSMVSIRRRHNLVVTRIQNSIRTGEVTLDKHIAGDQPRLRPDIVHYDGEKATIIDVSIPFDNGENALATAAEAKVQKYQSTKQALLDKGYTDVVILPFIVGALGTWYPRNELVLNRLGVAKRYRGLMRKFCCQDAIKGSRDIWTEHLTGHRQY